MTTLITVVIGIIWDLTFGLAIRMWALAALYDLFIAPLGFVVLDKYQVFGVAWVVSYVTRHTRDAKGDDEWDKLLDGIVYGIVVPALSVALAHATVWLWWPK